MRWRSTFLAVFALAAMMTTARADDKNTPFTPHFESLRWDKVNLRAGPGDQYPIRWVLTRKGMPVEVTDHYDVWRKIVDWQGSKGWVHERMLTGNRTVIVTGMEHVLRSDPSETAKPVAVAKPGVVGRLLSCHGSWCRIEAQGIKGWVERRAIFGVTLTETIE